MAVAKHFFPLFFAPELDPGCCNGGVAMVDLSPATITELTDLSGTQEKQEIRLNQEIPFPLLAS